MFKKFNDRISIVRIIIYHMKSLIKSKLHTKKSNLLKKNIPQFHEVVAYQFFLGETDQAISGKTEREIGTLKIIPTTDPNSKRYPV